ncbi:MAG: hypothetical protein B7Z30_12920 [Rhizobiales bacterium 12-68-15]|nr:MAG: hypothetical protein B7Z30_12920 [Rhizobiales bacterium 12-68-15]
MNEWASGYVSDVEYLPGLYVDQTPAHIALACLVNGFAPPETGAGHTYCELGCGQGVTANIIAASNPDAQVVAIDFNPAHIARARAAAKAAKLENIQFLELSFEEMNARDDLPDFDLVTMHGVWSWISDEGRRHITHFLNRRLKPGGAALVTYNAMPGWTALLPVQKLLAESAQFMQGRSDERVMQGLALVEALQKAGAGTLGDAKLLSSIRDGKGAESDRAVYLAHEYLNSEWKPLYHIDTARLLADAKLRYVGATGLLQNFPDLSLRPEHREALERVPAGPLRETLKDYLVTRAFRRDLFVRGPRTVPDAVRDRELAGYGLALMVPRSEAKTKMDVPAGTAELPKAHYEPIFDALAQGPRTLADLHAIAMRAKPEGAPSLVEIAGVLVGTAQATPIPPGAFGRISASAQLFNIASTQEVAEQRTATASISLPVTGSGMTLQTMEASVFHAVATGTPPEPGPVTDVIIRRLKAAGIPLRLENRVITEPSEQRAVVAESVEWCLKERMGLWTALGAL